MKELQDIIIKEKSIVFGKVILCKKNVGDMWSEACITCPTCVHSFFVGGDSVFILTVTQDSQ